MNAITAAGHPPARSAVAAIPAAPAPERGLKSSPRSLSGDFSAGACLPRWRQLAEVAVIAARARMPHRAKLFAYFSAQEAFAAGEDLTANPFPEDSPQHASWAWLWEVEHRAWHERTGRLRLAGASAAQRELHGVEDDGG